MYWLRGRHCGGLVRCEHDGNCPDVGACVRRSFPIYYVFDAGCVQSPSVIILTTFIVNARHLLLSASLAPYFSKYSLWKNIGIGVLLTDESFGVASDKLAKGGQVSDRWMNGLNITAYLVWIASCVAGGILGNWISLPEAFGLDFALPAMFLALLISQLQSVQISKLKHRLLLVLCMAVLMYLLSWWVPSHIAVIVATVMTATIGVLTDK